MLMKLRNVIAVAAIALLSLQGAAAGKWIRVNQLGYLPKATKVAVMMSSESASVTKFELVDAFSGKVVYTSTAVKATGEMGQMKSTFRLNFSDFKGQGTFKLKVGDCYSPTFAINGQVYRGTADYVLNYMRQQRCGYNPFQKDSCHTHDGVIVYHPTKEGQHIDARGGWHDAGDLLQYTPTSANAIYQMMFAYEQNPEAFDDHFLANGLPGKNGIPDIIDEIYWGLDWLDRMNPEPGELYNQIADDRDHIGRKLPNNDPADYGFGAGGPRPVYFVSGKPQQRGKFMNATIGAASTAGKFASDFALGSKILKPFYPEFSERIAKKAAPAYQVGIDKPGNNQTVSVVSPYIYEEDNWVDDMELAAIELYCMTGDNKYLGQAVEYGRREPITPWMGADSARHYQWYPFMNMGHYRLAEQSKGRVHDEFIRNFRTGIERVLERGKNHPFLWGVPGIWCSNNLTTAMLTQCILYRQLTGDTTYEEMEGSLRDWLLGCNPWGVSMIVGLPAGGNTPTQPHSQWVFEKIGTTPGGMVDGPVYTTIFNSLKGVNLVSGVNSDGANNYLDLQPGDVVFHDNMADYSTCEPTMDGTASLTFPFSAYEAEGRAQSDIKKDNNVYESYGAIIQANPKLKKLTVVFTADSFTDGAPYIISTLKKMNVKGAFFLTGNCMDMCPAMVRTLINDGHYVGSHSNGHLLYAPWSNRDSLLVTHDEFVADITKSYEKLASFGISKQQAPYFIPPYEYYNETINSWARELGLQLVNFTPGPDSSQDYTTPDMGKRYWSSKALYNRLMNFEKKYTLNGHLLMIHLGTNPLRTDKFYKSLPKIINTLRGKGYEFVSLPELIGLNMQ